MVTLFHGTELLVVWSVCINHLCTSSHYWCSCNCRILWCSCIRATSVFSSAQDVSTECRIS